MTVWTGFIWFRIGADDEPSKALSKLLLSPRHLPEFRLIHNSFHVA